jgi:hypothetical protein
VGSYYTQYPAQAANDYDAAFPAAERPAALFGGTWTPVRESDQAVFKTGGTISTDLYTPARSSGLQGHGVLNATGSIVSAQKAHTSNGNCVTFKTNTGVFNVINSITGDSLHPWISGAGNDTTGLFDEQLSISLAASNALFGASSSVVMRNRKMIVWKRAAACL